MASDYSFRRIVGVELLPSLHQIAQENLSNYKNDLQQCFQLESICADATTFNLPEDPLVLYMFNPLPEFALRHVVANLERSRRVTQNPMYVLYHNPLLEHVLCESPLLQKLTGNEQYSLWSNRLSIPRTL